MRTELDERAGPDWSSDKGAARKFVNDHWGEVENLFHRQRLTIDDALAVANGVAFRLVPQRRSGGGRNNPSKLGFLKIALTGTLSVFILHALAGWQVRLSMNRITMAPLIVQSWNNGGDFLLELRCDETTKKNAICMVRYVADCPVCDAHGRNAIHVDSGRMEFFGRLVGRCRNTPNEHVWSFDHVSKRGKPLR